MTTRGFIAALPLALLAAPAAAHLGAPEALAPPPASAAARCEPGYLGVALSEADGGVVIERVLESTPAEDAGLRAGDRIVAFEGREISAAEALVDEISGREAGDTVRLTVEREGWRRTFAITLAPRPQEQVETIEWIEEVEEEPILRDAEISTLAPDAAAPRPLRIQTLLREADGEEGDGRYEIVVQAIGADEECDATEDPSGACCDDPKACGDSDACGDAEPCEGTESCEARGEGRVSFGLALGDENGARHMRWVPLEGGGGDDAPRIVRLRTEGDDHGGPRLEALAVVELEGDVDSPEELHDVLVRRLGVHVEDADEHHGGDAESGEHHRHGHGAQDRDEHHDGEHGVWIGRIEGRGEGGTWRNESAPRGEPGRRIRVRLDPRGEEPGERAEEREIEIEVLGDGHRIDGDAHGVFLFDDDQGACCGRDEECCEEDDRDCAPEGHPRGGARHGDGVHLSHEALRLPGGKGRMLVMRTLRSGDRDDGKDGCEGECELPDAGPHAFGAFGLSGPFGGPAHAPRPFARDHREGPDRSGPPVEALRELREEIRALREEVRELRRALRERH